MTKASAIALFVLLSAGAAHAADGAPAEAPQSVMVAASSPAVTRVLICHQEAQTGSSITHKVCRSQEQVEGDRRAAEEAHDRIRYESGVTAEQRMMGGLGAH